MVRGSLLKPAFRKERADKGLAPWCVNVPPYLSDTGKRRQLLSFAIITFIRDRTATVTT